jgi:hypothetical protein
MERKGLQIYWMPGELSKDEKVETILAGFFRLANKAIVAINK